MNKDNVTLDYVFVYICICMYLFYVYVYMGIYNKVKYSYRAGGSEYLNKASWVEKGEW